MRWEFQMRYYIAEALKGFCMCWFLYIMEICSSTVYTMVLHVSFQRLAQQFHWCIGAIWFSGPNMCPESQSLRKSTMYVYFHWCYYIVWCAIWINFLISDHNCCFYASYWIFVCVSCYQLLVDLLWDLLNAVYTLRPMYAILLIRLIL